MEVIIDQNLCDGHSICIAKCPEVFEMNKDGKVHLKPVPIENDLRDRCLDAALACPTNAIEIVE